MIPTCCFKRQGGRVVSPSCHFRYEKDPFYELVATTVPPPSPAPLSVLPPPPQASPAPLSVLPPPPQATVDAVPPRASTAAKIAKTSAIVQTTIANVLPILLLVWSLQHV
ncbi:hypothetical protein NC653_027092 [Populus alba x Populus x berolinensis]|uniref:Uncharacterized protein n=1 Tax=Populus alba x Populus x berolinensis TaxID=444605 RepID=A0AAD6M4Q6_9ROSI|nr:hypothetical protein NC653_027092 [Populus alba x Populus x berolinensis]